MAGLVFAIEGIPRTTCYSEGLISVPEHLMSLVLWVLGILVEVFVGRSASVWTFECMVREVWFLIHFAVL